MVMRRIFIYVNVLIFYTNGHFSFSNEGVYA